MLLLHLLLLASERSDNMHWPSMFHRFHGLTTPRACAVEFKPVRIMYSLRLGRSRGVIAFL
jgi:hypothetical protein